MAAKAVVERCRTVMTTFLYHVGTVIHNVSTSATDYSILRESSLKHFAFINHLLSLLPGCHQDNSIDCIECSCIETELQTVTG